MEPSEAAVVLDDAESQPPNRLALVFVGIVLGLSLTVLLTGCLIRWLRARRSRIASTADSNETRESSQSRIEWPVSNLNYSEWKRRAVGYQRNRGTDTDWDRVICAICLEAIQDDETVKGLQCLHVFHSACADRWYSRVIRTCPVCRSGE